MRTDSRLPGLRRARTALVLGTLALLLTAIPATAQEESGQAKVTGQGYYTAPTKDALPPILVNEFPPGVVCILVPESCSPDAQAITDPIESVITGAEIPPSPVQPVPSGSLPIGLLGGQRRYASVLNFTLPQVPANSFIEKFDLFLTEEAGFAVESPAFRALIRSMVAQVDERGPEPFEKFVESVSSGEAGLLETEPTGIEACTIIEPWEPGENQEDTELPAYDCAFGANGERQEDGTWRFDLAFAMQGWVDGMVPFHGLYFGPLGPENLEYGDPDFSSNFIVYLAGQDAEEAAAPRYELVASEGLGSDFGPVSGPASGSDDVVFDDTSGGFDSGSSDFGTVGGDVGTGTADTPDVAQGTPGPSGDPQAAAPGPDGEQPVNAQLPLQAWLLLPLGLSFAALFARAVSAEPVPAGATRAGALSKLAGEE